MSIGVYIIRNAKNSKLYVGSSVDIETRWRKHKSDLRRRIHSSLGMQREWDGYGEDAFEFAIIEEVSDCDLLKMREEVWLQHYRAADPDRGYNVAPHADSCRGISVSTETRAKISAAITGKKRSAETRARMSLASKGRKYSADSRKKMSESAKLRASRDGLAEKNKQREWTPKMREQIADKVRYLDAYRQKDERGRYLPVNKHNQSVVATDQRQSL